MEWLGESILPNPSSPYKVAVFCVLSLVLGVSWYNGRSSTTHTNEPPIVLSKVPLVGHVASLLWNFDGFYKNIHKSNPAHLAVTIPLPGGAKQYMLVSPSLAATALRHKALSFDPWVRAVMTKLYELTPATVAKMTSHDPADPTRPGYLPVSAATLQSAMNGDNLRKTNQAVLDELSGWLDGLGREGDGVVEVENLYLFARDTLARATLRTLYGVHDPFSKDAELLEAVWTWDATHPTLLLIPDVLLSFLPTFLLPRKANQAIAAREKLRTAFDAYFACNGHLDSSVAPMIHHHKQMALAHGWTPAELAQVETSLAHVSVQNAAVAGFWMLVHILCSPTCFPFPPGSKGRQTSWGVEDIRREVDSFIELSSPESGDGGKVAVLKVGEMLAAHYGGSTNEGNGRKAQTLSGVYNEMLRLYTSFSPTRRTTADVVLGGTYTLRSGGDVVMPAPVLHRLPSIWETETTAAAAEFDPLRWADVAATDEDVKGTKSRLKAMGEAFMPFGGGKHLCPGRKFAFAEIMGLVIALVVGFDITPATVDGKLQIPAAGKAMMGGGILKPVGGGEGAKVRITRRKGWEKVRWDFVC